MIPRRVRLAVLIALVCHGLFILTARYRLSYDAYTHMLFADHYARDWFSLWEPRWYTGFTVVSYPPLTHQLIALFIPALGFDGAYALVLWAVTSAFPLGVYSFARIVAGKAAASHAALACALLLPVYVTAHIFGQLPFLAGTLLALFEAAALARYLREGGRLNLALSIALAAATMAAHHATLLLQPFLLIAVWVHQFRNQSLRQNLTRLALFVVPAILVGLLVIWPFWEWGMHQTMQAPIDHPSRHNFLTDSFAAAIFFWPMYGPLVAVIPFVFYRWPPRIWGLTFSFAILFLLGLGGTTRLPALLFGASWEWLTYDRFAFWASLMLLPFYGTLFILLRRRWTRRLVSAPAPVSVRRSLVSALVVSVFAATGVGSWLAPILFPYQPAPLDMQPIVGFLEEGDRSQWRYLTFGFGDQFAHLNLLTDATTIDGSYHTARTLPELRASGIGQVDTVYWAPQGIPAIGPILQESAKHGVRWGFVYRREFVHELLRNGWVFVKYLPNRVQVWENPQAVLPAASAPPRANPLASFSWGTLPLLALCIAAALAGLRLRPAVTEQVLAGVHSVAIGLLPIGLAFWYFRRLTDIEYPLIYFTYDNALFYLSDGLAVIAVVSWLIQRLFGARGSSLERPTAERIPIRRRFLSPNTWLLGLCLLASLSMLWSQEWRVSLYVSLHLWLVYALALSLQDRPELWRVFAWGACTALALQIFFGFWQFAIQSTAFLTPLALNWPGSLEPATRGVSVVQLFDGTRLLRVYGSVPHPNILGTLIIALLPGLMLIYINSLRRNVWLVILVSLSIALLVLTFSRAAWIGLTVSAAALVLRRRILDPAKMIPLGLAGLIGLLAVLIPLREYVFVRVTNAPVSTEQGSWDVRLWLTQRALEVFAAQPWLGTGIGNYALASASGLTRESLGVPDDFHLEPVHSVPLLALAELGIGGAVLVAGLGASILAGLARARRPRTLILASALIGLCVVELFDHFLWTLAPGRILFGLMLGLWAGQVSGDKQDQADDR